MDLNKNGNTGNTFKKYCITMKFNCKRNYFIFLYFVWIFLVNNMMVDNIWWNLSSPVLIIYPMSVKKLEQDNTWFLIFIELLISNMIYEYLIDKI